MVAAERRLTAIALVALLLVSAFPLVMPTAAAAESASYGAVFAAPGISVVRGSGGDPTLVRVGDTVTFYWNMTEWNDGLPAPCAVGSDVSFTNATVDARAIGGSSAAAVTVTGADGTQKFTYTQTVSGGPTGSATGMPVDGVSVRLYYTLDCSAPAADPALGFIDSATFRADNWGLTAVPSYLARTQTGRGDNTATSVVIANWTGDLGCVYYDGALLSPPAGIAGSGSVTGRVLTLPSGALETLPLAGHTLKLVPTNTTAQCAATAATHPWLNRSVDLVFPSIDVNYGASTNPPFVDGTNVGTLHVNTTGRVDLAYPAGSPTNPLGFQLIRDTIAGPRYWVHGTAGSNDDTAATTPHFRVAPDSTTRFQPRFGSAPAPNPTTSANDVKLTNLTAKDFVDGNYTLESRLVGDNGNTLVQSYKFTIDDNAPKVWGGSTGSTVNRPRNYSATEYDVGGMKRFKTIPHGADGNPITVLVNVTDYATDRDSGIKNITVELIDAATAAPVRRTTAGLVEPYARVNMTPADCGPAGKLPYCKDLRGILTDTSAANPCTSAPTSNECFARRFASTEETFTFVDDTRASSETVRTPTGLWKQFSGWVNLTIDDLPVGKYSVRVLATDVRGGTTSAIYATEYHVVPNVRIESSPTTPALVGDKLDLNVMTSQRLSEEANAAIGQSKAVSGCDPDHPDVCPADYVEIFLTNDITASLTNTQKVRKWENRSSLLATGRQDIQVNGYKMDGSYATNGALAAGQNPIPYFSYLESTESLTSNSVVDVTKPLFVKARAAHILPNGSHFTNQTEWIQVITSSVTGLIVNQPASEWSFAIEDGTLGKDRIPYNLTFDRRTSHGTGSMPQMRYTIYDANGVSVFTKPLANPLDSGLNPPKVKYNWTGTWPETGAAGLPEGDYRIHAEVLEGTELKAQVWRNFSVLPSAPAIKVQAADQGSPAIHVTGTGTAQTIYARNEFDVAFQIEHGAMNLTSLDQLLFNLTPGATRGSLKTNYGPIRDGGADEGFTVRVRPGSVLSEAATISYFNATVTIPASIDVRSGDVFGLQITALIDVPNYRLGNASVQPRLILDTEYPNATVRAADTAATVLATGASPPRNADVPAPFFVGQIKDNASGVKRIEVRVVDTVVNRAVVPSGDGWVDGPADQGGWMSTDLTAPIGDSHKLRHVYMTAPDSNGVRYWYVNATKRWVFVNDVQQNGQGQTAATKANDMPLNFNRTYRVDVRSIDNVGLLSDERSTLVKFDPLGPVLDYNGALTPNSGTFKSGIHAATTTVPWRGGAILTVNATDNNCLAVVRLVGKSDLNPETIVKADMSVVPKTGLTAEQTRCDKGKPIDWTINLGDAPQMTNDVSNYTYWFEAEDTAGLVTEVAAPYRTFRMRVTDATAAAARSVLVNPPIVGEGTRARIEAYVVENDKIHNVTVTAKYGNNNTLIRTVEMKPDSARQPAANGTGWYVADTTDDLDMTLALGDYLFEVVARDASYTTTCGFACFPASGLLRVVADAPPQIVQESPATGVTAIGALPTFGFKVLDRNIEPNGIRVEAGNGTLAVVTANLTEIKATNGSRQGYEIVYKPTTPFAHGQNVTVKVVATSSKGFVTTSTFNFSVDAQAPTVTANLTGNRTLGERNWAVAGTSVNLSSDAGNSVIRYKINGVEGPAYTVALVPTGTDGEWRLEYWAVDAAGNRAPSQYLNLSLDKTGPVIRASRHGDDVIVTVDDAGAGVDETNVTVHYAYGTDAFAAKQMEKLTGNSYTAALGGNASATGLRYWFDARDLLGNVGSNYSAATPHTIAKEGDVVVPPPENEAPTVVISNPTGTPPVTGNLEIRWVAQDPEGASVSITIALSEPEPGRVLVTGSENTGSYVLNTTGFAPGTYTIVVTASDGEDTATASAGFVIAGETIKLIDPPPATVALDDPVNFAVTIAPVGKNVSQASYTIVKAGRPVQSGQLRASANGAYLGAVTPAEPGEYRIVVNVVYSDGSSEPAKQVASFTVAGVVDQPVTRAAFPVSLMAVVILAVIVVGLGGYGAFGRWKK